MQVSSRGEGSAREEHTVVDEIRIDLEAGRMIEKFILKIGNQNAVSSENLLLF
jgi:hypothetical protein